MIEGSTRRAPIPSSVVPAAATATPATDATTAAHGGTARSRAAGFATGGLFWLGVLTGAAAAILL